MIDIDTLEEKDIKAAVFDFATAIYYVNFGLDPNQLKIENKTDVVLEAILKQQNSIVKNLVGAGFSLKDGAYSYLHHAIRSGDLDLVRFLLEAEPYQIFDVDKITKSNVLHEAVASGASDEVLRLLTILNKWNDLNIEMETPLFLLLANSELEVSKKFVDGLMNCNLDMNVRNADGVSPADLLAELKNNRQWCARGENAYLLRQLESKTK